MSKVNKVVKKVVKKDVKKVVKKDVKKVEKKVVEKVVLSMGGKCRGKGIGKFIKNRLIEMMVIEMNGGVKVDRKLIDSECMEKFGLDINGNKSRMKSISWHMNDLKNHTEWNGVELDWSE